MSDALGVSRQAVALVRHLDRKLRLPGIYEVRIIVSEHRRQPWEVEIARLDRLHVGPAPQRDRR